MKKIFNPHSIKTKELRQKPHWTAYVTWEGMDLQEYGETERNAVLLLLGRHMKWLGINNVDEEMKRIGY